MDINIDVRSKQLENLEQFISSSKQKLNMILKTLNWTEDKVREDKNLVLCSQDPNHRVPAQCLESHINNCRLKMLGYDLNEEFLSEPLHHPTATVVIDNQKKCEILSQAHRSISNFKSGWNGVDPDPMTADRLITTFTSDERLALYNYAKDATTGPPILPEFNVVQSASDNKELTYEMRLEQERNAKRRRIKYKTVHTSHKSHKEVIRDVINNQMEAYQEWLKENEPKIKIEQAESISSIEESCSNSRHVSDDYDNTRIEPDDYRNRSRVESDDHRNNRSIVESDDYRNRSRIESDDYRTRKTIESDDHRNRRESGDYRVKLKLESENGQKEETDVIRIRPKEEQHDFLSNNDYRNTSDVFRNKNEYRQRPRAESNDYRNKHRDGSDYRHRSRPECDDYRVKSVDGIRHSKERVDDYRNRSSERSSGYRRNGNFRSREQSHDSGKRDYTKRKSDYREERRHPEGSHKKSRYDPHRR